MFFDDDAAAGGAGDGAHSDDDTQDGEQLSGGNRQSDQRGDNVRTDGRRKPQFSEEQNRWIGAMRARDEDKRRAVEGERDALKEKAANLESRVSAMEREAREARAENAVIAAAAKAKAENPAHVYRMLRDDLQYGDDGKPKDVEALVAQFKTENPRYFGAVASSGADGGKGNDEGNTEKSMNDIIREQYAASKIKTVRSVARG